MLKNCHKILGKLIILLIFMASIGCVNTINNNVPAIPPLALNANPDYTGLDNQLVLMTLKIQNNAALKFKPNLQTIKIRNDNTKIISEYVIGAPYRIANGNKIYLLSFSLPAGNYELTSVVGHSSYNNVVTDFIMPLHIHLSAGQNGIVYLGSIDVNLQQRITITSLWSGSIANIADQSKHDFSGGNFNVKVADNYAEDMTDYSGAYPALIDQNIVKSILTDQQQLFEE